MSIPDLISAGSLPVLATVFSIVSVAISLYISEGPYFT